jgi:hypothetical protein
MQVKANLLLRQRRSASVGMSSAAESLERLEVLVACENSFVAPRCEANRWGMLAFENGLVWGQTLNRAACAVVC